MNKGQVFTADLVSSIALFSFFIIFFGLIWNITSSNIKNSNLQHTEGYRAFNILQSEGVPSDWDESNVNKPGLYFDGYFNRSKFLEFENISTQEKRNFFQSREFKIEVKYLNDSLLMENGKNFTIKTSDIPGDQSVYTYRDITIDQKTSKRVKVNLFRWGV